MKVLVSLAIGITFGIGLTISGMVNPAKVLNFLDFAAIESGNWDPTLAFVFAAGLAVSAIGVAIYHKLENPVIGDKFHVSNNTSIDSRLLTGAALFGAGWGLVGICPGPALAGLAVAGPQLIGLALFGAAMIAGMLIASKI